jgi:hypothetical protein
VLLSREKEKEKEKAEAEEKVEESTKQLHSNTAPSDCFSRVPGLAMTFVFIFMWQRTQGVVTGNCQLLSAAGTPHPGVMASERSQLFQRAWSGVQRAKL